MPQTALSRQPSGVGGMSVEQFMIGMAELLARGGALSKTTKDADTTGFAINPHGKGGLFGVLGLSPDVVNAMVAPLAGLAAELPVMMSNETNPLFSILTGQTASTGEEPSAPCVGGKQPGNLKQCIQTWPFGRITMDSNPMRIDQAGQIINRGEFLDQRLVGNPFADVPMPKQVSPDEALRSYPAKLLLELMNAVQLDYRPLFYTGSYLNTIANAPDNGYVEYFGLNYIINPGYRDAIANVACPAADPTVAAFGGQNVGTASSAIINLMVELYWFVDYLAQQTKLQPAQWCWAMRQSLFRELTKIWPCAYYTYQCTVLPTGGDNRGIVDARDMRELRDDMYNNQFLLIDGKRVDVILDDAIPETYEGGGAYESDIYLVCKTISGNTKALYQDYFNWRAPYGAAEAIRLLKSSNYEITPDARYIIHYMPPTYWCNQISLLTRPRLVARAPFLNGRITDVRYTPMFHERVPFQSDPYNYKDGGQTTYAAPTYYAPRGTTVVS